MPAATMSLDRQVRTGGSQEREAIVGKKAELIGGPGATVLGTPNGQDPAARAVPGVCEQLTYIHWMNAEGAAPGVYSPIQSLAVGLGIPLQVAVRVSPRTTVVGLALSVTPPSLSVIVSTAVLGLPSVTPPVGLLSVRVSVSFPSTRVSLMIGMLTVLLAVSPAAKLTDWVTAV